MQAPSVIPRDSEESLGYLNRLRFFVACRLFGVTASPLSSNLGGKFSFVAASVEIIVERIRVSSWGHDWSPLIQLLQKVLTNAGATDTLPGPKQVIYPLQAGFLPDAFFQLLNSLAHRALVVRD